MRNEVLLAELISEFSRRLSHSIRTPLSTIQNVVDEASIRGSLSDESYADASHAISQVVAMLSRGAIPKSDRPMAFSSTSLSTLIVELNSQNWGLAKGTACCQLPETEISCFCIEPLFAHALTSVAVHVANSSSRAEPVLRLTLETQEGRVLIACREDGSMAESPERNVSLSNYVLEDARVEVLSLLLAEYIFVLHDVNAMISFLGQRVLVATVELPVEHA